MRLKDQKLRVKKVRQKKQIEYTGFIAKVGRQAGKITYQDRHSTFNNSVRDAIRRGAAENEVQKHNEKLTGVWRQMSTFRRRYESGVKVTT